MRIHEKNQVESDSDQNILKNDSHKKLFQAFTFDMNFCSMT